MDLKEAQQALQDVTNLEADVTRLEEAIAQTSDRIDRAQTPRDVKSLKASMAAHAKELKVAQKALSEAKKTVVEIPEADRKMAEVTPIVVTESVEAHAGLASANGANV